MSITVAQVEAVWRAAQRLYSGEQVEAALDSMAAKITAQIATQNPIVLSVMTGGIVCTGRLLPKLAFPLTLDYVHATRYRNDVQGKDVRWEVLPHSSLEGRVVLVVDDILDEGYTLLDIVAKCREQNAQAVYSAVLVEKLHDRKAPGVQADFVGLTVGDQYVFGVGMDYKGYLRNVDGVYAVRETTNKK